MIGLGFGEAVLQGLGTDRGLLVPETIPKFPAGALEKWKDLSFQDLAFEIMSLYVPPDEVPQHRAFLDRLGYVYHPETENPVYQQFMR